MANSSTSSLSVSDAQVCPVTLTKTFLDPSYERKSLCFVDGVFFPHDMGYSPYGNFRNMRLSSWAICGWKEFLCPSLNQIAVGVVVRKTANRVPSR